MINVGTKVEGFYGAMIPPATGYVASIIDNVAMIAWLEYDEDGVIVGSLHEQVRVGTIKAPGTKSANGSPIGIFFAE